jgi:hypothetical protein
MEFEVNSGLPLVERKMAGWAEVFSHGVAGMAAGNHPGSVSAVDIA